MASLGQTQRFLSALGTKTWCADEALWTDLPGGWRLGFCEGTMANTDGESRSDAVTEEMEKFQGTWTQVAYEKDGVAEPLDERPLGCGWSE